MTDETLHQDPEENEVDTSMSVEDVSISEDPEVEIKSSKKPIKQILKPQPSVNPKYSPEDYRAMMKEVIKEEREERAIEKIKSSLSKEQLDYINKYKMTNEQIKILVNETNDPVESNEYESNASQKPSILTNHSLKDLPEKKVVFHNNFKDIDYIVRHFPDSKEEKLRDYRNGLYKVPTNPIKK